MKSLRQRRTAGDTHAHFLRRLHEEKRDLQLRKLRLCHGQDLRQSPCWTVLQLHSCQALTTLELVGLHLPDLQGLRMLLQNLPTQLEMLTIEGVELDSPVKSQALVHLGEDLPFAYHSRLFKQCSHVGTSAPGLSILSVWL